MRTRGGVVAQAAVGVLVTAWAAVGLAPAVSAAPGSTAPYIVSGTNAPPGAWPWIAALLVQGQTAGSYFEYCDGTLVAPSWVVTAAHCVTGDAPPMPDAIVIGRQTPSASDGDTNHAVQIVVHPSWNPNTTENDVALIRLQHPSPFAPLSLIRHEQRALWTPGASAEVIGFGDTDPNRTPSDPTTLQQAPQKIIDDASCSTAYAGKNSFVATSMLCTAVAPETPCFGDSGGPLMVGDGVGWREVGVVSHGSSPCGGSPPVYTRLESEIDWIYATIDRQVTRLFGDDRVATAIMVSHNSFPTALTASSAVLVNIQAFADALPGTPLAVAKRGPLLLTGGNALDGRVETELGRALPSGSTVYVLGGTNVMSATIDARLGQLGYTVVRFGGDNRFQTATIIADQGLGNPSTVLEATGLDFADALSAGAAAAAIGGAVLLTNGAAQATATAQYLAAHAGAARDAIGGAAAAADTGATPVVGSDRFATSVAVAQRFFAGPTIVGIASGLTFADGLPGGAHIGAKNGPLLLVPSNGLIVGSVQSYLRSQAAGLTRAFLYGGPSAVSLDMAEDVGQAIS